jgi:predicted transcriptional regulator
MSAIACADRGNGVVINEEEAMGVAYDKSVELATAVAEAKSYEEFSEARAELEAYEEAMRQQIGGEDYEVFLSSANEVLKNLK